MSQKHRELYHINDIAIQTESESASGTKLVLSIEYTGYREEILVFIESTSGDQGRKYVSTAEYLVNEPGRYDGAYIWPIIHEVSKTRATAKLLQKKIKLDRIDERYRLPDKDPEKLSREEAMKLIRAILPNIIEEPKAVKPLQLEKAVV